MTSKGKANGQRELTLSELFSAAEGRRDRWSQLSALATAWAGANEGAKGAATLRPEIEALLEQMVPLEDYWAYPGAALMNVLRERLAEGDAVGVARAAQVIRSSIVSGSYRHDAGAWKLDDDSEPTLTEHLPPGLAAEAARRPYFELLLVTPVAPGLAAKNREELRKLRRPEDAFVYESVRVGNFEDGIVGALLNTDVQAVVLYDGFPFKSHYTLPLLHETLKRFVGVDVDSARPQQYALALARIIKGIRPELDIYLVSDQAVETVAGHADSQAVRRVFYGVEDLLEIHLAVLDGVNDRYETPYFDNLKQYAQRPMGTFHALPVARGKSIFKSNWIRDMGQFYGLNLFLAESSATTGGLDSLLEPTGNIKVAQDKAARAFGADRAYFATNGTSTSNKIILQALCRPGDIVIIDRNCHKSHHYAMVLAGAQPYYVEAYPMTEYSMYGAVPLRTIKKALLDLAAEGKLDKVRLVDLTNCSFDGHMYNTKRVMEECLAIKPDLIFLWDEAWFGFARYSLFHRRRTAMGAAEYLEERYRSPEYRKEYAAFKAEVGKIDPKNAKLLELRLLPDPDKARVRVYQTNSTHKSMSCLRQGSMMLVHDQDFHEVEEAFGEAFFTHTSTSPNLQIIATLDVARRQMELEGYGLVLNAMKLALELRRQVNTHPLISKYFRILTNGQMVPKEFRETGIEDYGGEHSNWKSILESWERDEFALDPTRVTLVSGHAGFDGTQFKSLLANKYDVQINKTSRNSILVQTNINNTRSDIAHLIKVLADISHNIEQELAEGGKTAQAVFDARVKSLMKDVPDLPNFSRFHDAFRDDPKSKTAEGHMRAAFFKAYREEDCEHIKLDAKELDERLKDGPELVAANFVIPYPPGFPIMVPGQVITRETITFMRKLDVKEIHGYHAAIGLKVIKQKALEARKAKSGDA